MSNRFGESIILLVSSKFDYSTDYLSKILKEQGHNFFRINTEELADSQITLRPQDALLEIIQSDFQVNISGKTLRSVYYRAPVFLRENTSTDGVDRLKKSQWAAFLRNLHIFSDALWVNAPQAIYRAEAKAIQLHEACKVGFKIPDTVITNNSESVKKIIKSNKFAGKSLDTFLHYQDEDFGFLYTSVFNQKELNDSEVKSLPGIYQTAILPKRDWRITIIDNKAFAVRITGLGDSPPYIDWRLLKEQVQYEADEIPKQVTQFCIELVQRLGLKYGAIDLLEQGDKFYFLEINPTGEWGWLRTKINLPIDLHLASLLSNSRHHA